MGSIPYAEQFSNTTTDTITTMAVIENNLSQFGELVRRRIVTSHDDITADRNLISHFGIMQARQAIRTAANRAWGRGRA